MMKHKTLNFLKLNIRYLITGIILLILGYLILGWNSTSGQSYEERLFAWHKMTLAPIILLLGYTIIGYSIMHQKKN